MASGIEIQIAQRDKLYDLLALKKVMQNEKDSAGYKLLLEQIRKTKAVMQAEDVAYVEKMLAED
jgi:ABC-type transporter Mla MlaB component